MKTCSVEGCENKHYGKGLCNKHFQKWRKHGDPLAGRECSPVQIGERFGRLEVVGEAGKRGKKNKSRILKCQCDCGEYSEISANRLRRGKTQSCGCWQKESTRERFRLGYGESARNRVKENYKKNSIDRNLSWGLSDEELFDKIVQSCYYCGSQKENCSRNYYDEEYGHFWYTGLDRYDSSRGYETENVVPCCQTCNFMKGSIDGEEFLEMITKIYEYRKNGDGETEVENPV